ncbi:MAG: hypothetical protein Q9157_005567 [Trypethelium eluteriae]
MKERAVLKKEVRVHPNLMGLLIRLQTDLDDCANTFVMLAKNTSMTGMKIQVDAGLFPGSA